HPRGREYLDRAYESLKRAFDDRREIRITRIEGRLYFDGVLLDRERALSQQLGEELAARGVDSIGFHSTITPEEHRGLMRGLLTKAERVSEKGGFGQLLLDEGVGSVRANAERTTREASDIGSWSESRLMEFLLYQVRAKGAQLDDGETPGVGMVLERD